MQRRSLTLPRGDQAPAAEQPALQPLPAAEGPAAAAAEAFTLVVAVPLAPEAALLAAWLASVEMYWPVGAWPVVVRCASPWHCCPQSNYDN